MVWLGFKNTTSKNVYVSGLLRLMAAPEAMAALLQLVMYPFWDDEAMDRLSAAMFRCASVVPFYHLKNLPEEAATILTHSAINEKVRQTWKV